MIAVARRWLAVCAALLGPALAWAQGVPQLDLPRVELRAGMYRIDAQVAANDEQRGKGLMFRREMAPNEGMLFVFERPARQCFWMRNTPLALSAAFVLDDGTIANIAQMQPLSDTSHCSVRPVRYVLEMHQGWFAKKGFKAGTRLGGAPFER